MGRVQRGTQVTGRHTVVLQDTGRQQRGSWQQRGWKQPPAQPREQEMGRKQEPVMAVSGAELA